MPRSGASCANSTMNIDVDVTHRHQEILGFWRRAVSATIGAHEKVQQAIRLETYVRGEGCKLRIGDA
jgi:O-glycosyl hydrolase